MLARLYTRLALATCPFKGWTSHDLPIDQIGSDLTTRLSELRAKVMHYRGQPLLKSQGSRHPFYGNLVKQSPETPSSVKHLVVAWCLL